ncbi:MAG: hypothetical protein JRN68_09130 [Nitrososphaerota archaeon]|jgi:phosphomannomutase|nr:hypothetical protein [Nitrososphaerota archaeon]
MVLLMETISGLRGLYGQGITTDYAFRVACRYANWLGPSDVAVGMDTRTSSLVIAKAVLSGLMHGGSNPVWIGSTTTPELFRFVSREGLRGGIMVTASHNPKEWNGLKLVRDGRGVFENELNEILSSECHTTIFGQPRSADASHYFDEILGVMGKGDAHGLKVALDLGGGSACYHVPSLFRDAGAEVLALNSSPGVFTRIIDPTQDELVQLRRIVVSEGCDVGFAFDCDGDRLQVVDSQGRKMPPDYALFVAVKQRKGSVGIAISVDTSDAVVRTAEQAGAKVFLTPVGEANVVKTILENDCVLGGEGSSAGVIEPSFSLCRDGLLAAARILKEIASTGRLDPGPFSTHHQMRTKIEVERRRIPGILKSFLKEHPDATTIDGVKFRTDDGWVLLRASRTEDVLRISVESGSEQAALHLANRVKEQIVKITGSSGK